MYLKIALCDDSEADRTYLSALVERWAAGAGHTVQLSAFESAEQFLFVYAEKSDYDILLLDVEMGAMDGVTMAKRLRSENDLIQIVFITGYSDYIAEGYEVAALHYLMKPVREEKLFAVLDRAAEKTAKNEKVLYFETGGDCSTYTVNGLTPGKMYKVTVSYDSGMYYVTGGMTVTGIGSEELTTIDTGEEGA